MFDVNIIRQLQAFLQLYCSDSNLLALFRRCPQDITRPRKLTFSRLVRFLAELCKKTLSVEPDQFFEQDIDQCCSCSVSTHSQ